MPLDARPAPQQSGRHRLRAAGRSRAASLLLQSVALLCSLAVVACTGVGWYVLRDVTQGMTTSDALAGGVSGEGVAPSTDGAVNVLLIGLDSRKDQNGEQLPAEVLEQLHAGDGTEGGYNTNTLIVMHIPRDGSTVAAFSIPRDDYVPVRGIPGRDHVKIKEAYGRAKVAAEDELARTGVSDRRTLESAGREAGRRSTVQTVQDFLGVTIDHFAEVNLAGFYDMATALNGVEVCLNNPVRDLYYSGADFVAGRQTLNGAQALAFVRQRHGLANGDLDRTRRQQAFLASVTHKLSRAGTFTNFSQLQSLIEVVKQDVVLSAGWDIPTFVQQATNLTGGNVEFATLPVERFDTVDGQAVNIVDSAAVRKQVRIAFGMQDPDPPVPAFAGPYTVDVHSAAGSGAASTVSRALVAAGMLAGAQEVTAAEATAVTFGEGARDTADVVSGLLGAQAATPDPALPIGRVKVVLGKGFRVPTALAQDARTRLAPPSAPAGEAPAGAAPAVTPSGPQALPADSSGIPCVD
ncbi:LCP family protein [Rhodococcus sp. X156]|uniref:LCP family protein n=1 Tax=Rhodococcus sp. X156 TaxID=2499145 RepID=UPI000FD924BF|nr:LCP family protein [Rhodococcus sp. X156]